MTRWKGGSMKTIYILLTRSNTLLSRIIHLITADPYTHVSISFNQSLQSLYSSARKNGVTMFPAGPCKEQLQKGYYKRHPDIPCALYELEVTDEVFYDAKEEVHNIMKEADLYSFNIFGLILCRLNIPYHRKRHYFCSQFVGDILLKSHALELPKDSSLMRPMDYTGISKLECRYEGHLSGLLMELSHRMVA